MANAVAPFERGWWLTAYLFLVGGLAQLLLIRGQDALTAGPREPPASLVWAQWGLWNAGTAIVAVADMAQVMAGVDAGSVALLLALVLYQVGARRARAEVRATSFRTWVRLRGARGRARRLGAPRHLPRRRAARAVATRQPGAHQDRLAIGSVCSHGRMARGQRYPDRLSTSPIRPHREYPMTNHPLYDIAVVIAHIFVVGMSVAAVRRGAHPADHRPPLAAEQAASLRCGVLKTGRCSLDPMCASIGCCHDDFDGQPDQRDGHLRPESACRLSKESRQAHDQDPHRC